jgi:probable F420-dependent oxidoreductase
VAPYWLGRPPGEALDVVAAADRAELAEAWIGEMLSFDAFALAGAAARETGSIRLTVGPLPVSVRTPVGIAMGVAGLGALTRPERIGLALGGSSKVVSEVWHRRPWVRVPEQMTHTLSEVRTVLAGGRSTGSGPDAGDGFRLAIPAVVPPITVAAFGPRMRAVAVEGADRLVLNLVTPAHVAAVVADVDPLPVAVWVVAGLDPSREALAAVRRQLAFYLAAPGYADMFRTAGHEDLVDAAVAGTPVGRLAEAIPDALIEAVAAVGSTADVLAGIDRFQTAGAAHVALVPMTWDDPAGARLFALVGGG